MDYLTCIPWDCAYRILEITGLRDLLNIYQLNTSIYNNIDVKALLKKKHAEHKEKKKDIRRDYLDRYFGIYHTYGNWIQTLFGNKLLTAKILEWNDRFLGSTSYIDSISRDDVKGDLMIGVDPYDRPFFILRENDDKLVTYFKRHTDKHSFIWASASGYKFGFSKIGFKKSSTYGYTDTKFKKLVYKHAAVFKDELYYADTDDEYDVSSSSEVEEMDYDY